jgi:hypothetical protein
MKQSIIPIMIIGVALLGCAIPASDANDIQAIAPTQAILLAADAAPLGVKGTFALEVRAVGRQDGNIYLNSELDYRDQRNLTVAIFPDAAQQCRQKFGEDADVVLKGKRIKVRGEAIRVKIGFVADGALTDKYYYQTHVNVYEANQVEVLP